LCSLSLSLLAALRSTPRTNLVGRPLLCNDPATPVSYTLSLHDALPICAVDIQYWFFYPYNDWVASVNHEADWEHITVVASGDGTLRGVWYANHNGGDWYEPGEVPLTAEGRPVVYVADGSHASYPVAGTFNHGPGFDDRTYDGGPVWRTWENW